MGDVLGINETQTKILNSIIVYEEKTESHGVTKYDLDDKIKNKKVINLKFRVASSTFVDHIEYLEKIALVKKVEEKKRQWAKKQHREKIMYTVTDIGKFLLGHFAYNNIEIADKLELSFINLFPLKQFGPKLKKLYDVTIIAKLLGKAINSIKIESGSLPFPTLKNYKKFDRGITIKELTELDLALSRITIFRAYVLASNTDYETKKEEWKKYSSNMESYGLNQPKNLAVLNHDMIEISILWRVMGIFFYNLLRLGTDSAIINELRLTATYARRFKEQVKEGREEHAIESQIRKLMDEDWKKWQKSQKEVHKIIQTNETLEKTFTEIINGIKINLGPFIQFAKETERLDIIKKHIENQ